MLSPSAVALSNPTELKSAKTKPRRSPLPVIPRDRSSVQSKCRPRRSRTSAITVIINVTETASIHSMSRAEILTSRQAMGMENLFAPQSPYRAVPFSRQIPIGIKAAKIQGLWHSCNRRIQINFGGVVHTPSTRLPKLQPRLPMPLVGTEIHARAVRLTPHLRRPIVVHLFI